MGKTKSSSQGSGLSLASSAALKKLPKKTQAIVARAEAKGVIAWIEAIDSTNQVWFGFNATDVFCIDLKGATSKEMFQLATLAFQSQRNITVRIDDEFTRVITTISVRAT